MWIQCLNGNIINSRFVKSIALKVYDKYKPNEGFVVEAYISDGMIHGSYYIHEPKSKENGLEWINELRKQLNTHLTLRSKQ